MEIFLFLSGFVHIDKKIYKEGSLKNEKNNQHHDADAVPCRVQQQQHQQN